MLDSRADTAPNMVALEVEKEGEHDNALPFPSEVQMAVIPRYQGHWVLVPEQAISGSGLQPVSPLSSLITEYSTCLVCKHLLVNAVFKSSVLQSRTLLVFSI